MVSHLKRATVGVVVTWLAVATANCTSDLRRDDLDRRPCPCLDGWAMDGSGGHCLCIAAAGIGGSAMSTSVPGSGGASAVDMAGSATTVNAGSSGAAGTVGSVSQVAGAPHGGTAGRSTALSGGYPGSGRAGAAGFGEGGVVVGGSGSNLIPNGGSVQGGAASGHAGLGGAGPSAGRGGSTNAGLGGSFGGGDTFGGAAGAEAVVGGASNAGSNGAGEGGASGSAGVGNQAGIPACLQPPAAPVSTIFPSPPCSPSSRDACVIDCSTVDCSIANVCPPGMPCTYVCGAKGCGGILASCPSGYACRVECLAPRACENLTLDCMGSGSCLLVCGSDARSCEGAKLLCDQNDCAASCAGKSKPTVSKCESSCRKTGCGC